MRTQSWIRFIGIVCVLIGAFGIYSSSWGLSYIPFSVLKMELAAKTPLHIIKWRHSLKYLSLLVSVVYFIAGVYFLYKKSFSLRLMYFALSLSILKVIVPIIFLNPYSNIQEFARYSFKLFNFIRPIIDIGLLTGVFIISRNYYLAQSEPVDKAGSNYRVPVALISGLAINMLIVSFSGLFSLGCLSSSVIIGGAFLFAGLALGYYWPSFSWKTGLWLVASVFFVFYPLGMLSSWFAHGWGFAFSILLNCDIFTLITILAAGCLGSFLGSLLKRRIVL